MLWHFLRFVTDNVRYFMCLFLVRNCHLIDLKKFDVSLMRISSASFFRSRLFLFFFLFFFTWWNWWDFSMLVKIHFSWKDRNVLSILLLNQNLVVSLCCSFSFQWLDVWVEIKRCWFRNFYWNWSSVFDLALDSLAQFIFHKFWVILELLLSVWCSFFDDF